MGRPVTPLVAVDILVFRSSPSVAIARELLLIRRRNPPHGWATPGGFVDVGETVEAAAVREAREETGLYVRLEGLVGVYSDPDRDPRGHTVSIAFLASAAGDAVAGDDASAVRWVDPRDETITLAFDGRRMVEDALRLLDLRASPAPR